MESRVMAEQSVPTCALHVGDAHKIIAEQTHLARAHAAVFDQEAYIVFTYI